MSHEKPVPDAYRSLVGQIIDNARKALESAQDVKAEMVVGNLSTGQIVPIPFAAGDVDNKERAGEHARAVARTISADFMVVVSESWSVSLRDHSRIDWILERYGSVGEYPGRIEVISVSLETHYGRWMGYAPIKPLGISKRKRTFGEVTFFEGNDAQGRLANVIPLDPDAKGSAGLQ